ncbi:MAG: methyltransferase domain-containing protein [Planctomycetota bacterium]
MDAPDLDPIAHRAALKGLRRLNTISGVSLVLFPQLLHFARQQPNRPLKILDVASGSADLPIAWIKRARRRGLEFQITALDRSETALKAAAESASASGITLGTIKRDCLNDGLPTGFDVVTCNLFMHHLTDDQVVSLIHEMWRVSQRHLLICDLERSRFNAALVGLASRLVTRSPIVHFDAIASVRGAYTRHEFAALIHRALGFSIPVRRSLPCRFVATLEQSCEVIRQPGWVPHLKPVIAGAAS